MSLVKQPVKGMRDILPNEKELRDNIFGEIKKVYKSFGFNIIETPIMEHIENLTGNMGGENEKLVFEVLKRGEKLEDAINGNGCLSDSGLRYDLTMPLSRYFANNMENLPYPFKAFQFGDVFRADRPQKGRFRQFKQCDIDIFGEPSIYGEIELLTATTTFLKTLKDVKFKIKINDRRLLKMLCEKSGFDDDVFGDVLIALDKIDKIGINGVKDELLKLDIDNAKVQNYIDLLKKMQNSSDSILELEKYLSCENASEIVSGLKFIINTIKEVNGFDVEFDISIIRGMGYYTGTIYEIFCEDYGFAIGGGGRYDNMVGGFSGQNVPAVGISIGFERLALILEEKKVSLGEQKNKIAVLFDSGIDSLIYLKLLKIVYKLRDSNIVYFNKMNKNIRNQKDSLQKLGYNTFFDIKNERDIDALVLATKL